MFNIDIIQQRLSGLDYYLKSLDEKFTPEAKLPEAKPKDFSSVLTEATQVQSKVVESQKLPKGFDEYIHDVAKGASREYGIEIPTNLVKSIIKQESGFNPKATSKAGAEGLMQLMPNTAKEMGVFDSMNPFQNLKGGVRYFGKMLKNYSGNIQKALAAYNAGPQAVNKYGGIPPYKETQNYVESIMTDYLARENYKPVDMTA